MDLPNIPGSQNTQMPPTSSTQAGSMMSPWTPNFAVPESQSNMSYINHNGQLAENSAGLQFPVNQQPHQAGHLGAELLQNRSRLTQGNDMVLQQIPNTGRGHGPGLPPCPFCGKTFRKLGKVRQHLSDAHDKRICLSCFDSFKSAFRYFEHTTERKDKSCVKKCTTTGCHRYLPRGIDLPVDHKCLVGDMARCIELFRAAGARIRAPAVGNDDESSRSAHNVPNQTVEAMGNYFHASQVDLPEPSNATHSFSGQVVATTSNFPSEPLPAAVNDNFGLDTLFDLSSALPDSWAAPVPAIDYFNTGLDNSVGVSTGQVDVLSDQAVGGAIMAAPVASAQMPVMEHLSPLGPEDSYHTLSSALEARIEYLLSVDFPRDGIPAALHQTATEVVNRRLGTAGVQP